MLFRPSEFTFVPRAKRQLRKLFYNDRVKALKPLFRTPQIQELRDQRIEETPLPARIVVLFIEDIHLVLKGVAEGCVREVVQQSHQAQGGGALLQLRT